MLPIKDQERVILTLKGLEQYYSLQHNLSQHESWFIELIYGEHHIDRLIRNIIRYRAQPLIIENLFNQGYLRIILAQNVDREKKSMNTAFLTKQMIGVSSNEAASAKFEDFDFERNDSKIENYVEGLSLSEISIMPYSESGRVSVYSSGSTTGGSSGSELSESKGGKKVSTKTPEVRAFEEIKKLLIQSVKEVFTFKSYFYSYQLKRVKDRAELNEFFTKIYQPCLDIKGKNYMENLLKKIQSINDYYFTSEKNATK